MSAPQDHNLPAYAISPLDGRYRNQLSTLASSVSEAGLVGYRLQVEAGWLLHLADTKHMDFVLNDATRKVLEGFAKSANQSAAYEHVKKLEQTTNHDVKAVEYYLAEQLKKAGAPPELLAHVHFGCTSEDINNISYALMMRDARDQVVIPVLQNLISVLRDMALRDADTPMLSHTHGQPASPTTLGKEFAVFVQRLQRQVKQWQNVSLQAKINGAVGAFNAHMVAYPECDWPKISQTFIEKWKLEFNPLTTQIENHDSVAEYFDALRRVNMVLMDLSKDVWAYISLNYLGQKPKEGEVGSSTMPHKVNPIDFENAEGNLGLAQALCDHLSTKLPVSRLQRDLSDSTVLRNTGTVLGYSLLAYNSLLKGLSKITVNKTNLAADLKDTPEVLSEAVQMTMRRYGVVNAYEILKQKTRGQNISLDDLHALIKESSLPDEAKNRLLTLTPESYVGLAAELTKTLKT